MKKFSLLFVFLVLIAPSLFSAQSGFQGYALGSSDHPVTVKEYWTFLSQSKDARKDYVGMVYGCYYYDHLLMDSGVGKTPVIIRSGMENDYSYAVVPGHENDIVQRVESKVAADKFASWRTYISLGDVRDYLNDQIAIQYYENNQGYSSVEAHQNIILTCEDSNKISSWYPQNDKSEFAKLEHAITLVFQHDPQSYQILKGTQGCKERPFNWSEPFASRYYPVLINTTPVLTIAFAAAAGQPVVALADGVNEFERLDVDDDSYGAHLQFPVALGEAVVPDFEPVSVGK